MRIAFVGQKGIPALAGGVERHVEELAARLAARGHEVTAYVRDNYTARSLADCRGVRLVHLPSIGTKHLDAISHTLLATLHALFQPYDLVHFHSIGPSTLCWIVRLFRSGIPLVATFHSRDYFHRKWGPAARAFLHLGEYVICKVPMRTVVLTRAQQRFVRERFGTETVVIPNGCGMSFNPGTGELARWGLSAKRYVLSVSRLIEHKGIHHLIDAFRRLEGAGRLPDGFKLVVVGSGFHTDAYERRLKAMAEGSERIVFTGTQSGAALEQLFSHAYLFVQPSESEGLSISLLEAIGCGVAPLVSDIPENTEPLRGLGYTFAVRDAADLTEKLGWALHNPAEIHTMGEMARELAAREYSWDVITDRHLALYEELVRWRRGGQRRSPESGSDAVASGP